MRQAILKADVHFRRSADYLQIQGAEVKVEHIGRWIQHAQRPIDCEWVGASFPLQPLAQHHLENIARGDILPRSRYHFLISFGGHVRTQDSLACRTPARAPTALWYRRQRPEQSLTYPLDALDSGHVSHFHIVAAGQVNVRQNLQPVAGMVKDHQRIRQQEYRIRRIQHMSRRLRQALELANHIIAQIADHPAVEAG